MVSEGGVVSFIDNTVDPTTGTIKLKGTFPNADHALWPGLFVQVTLVLSTDPNAVVVPAAAVQASQAGQYVFVVKPDRTVEMRTVTVERQQGEEMVIAAGADGGRRGRHRRPAAARPPGARVTTGTRGAGRRRRARRRRARRGDAAQRRNGEPGAAGGRRGSGGNQS